MSRLTGRRPEHELIYTKIKEMVLFGDFAPSQPLTIHGLVDVVGAGVTPVREAIRRLTSEGALETLENRRVAVPQMTVKKLDQIEFIRMSIEPKLAELAVECATPKLISSLEEFDAQVDHAIEQGDIREYLEANYNFHFALYRHAKADIYLKHAESLWLEIAPSLRVVCARFGTSNLKDCHREAVEGLRNGDAGMVKKAFQDDIQQGLDFVRKSISE